MKRIFKIMACLMISMIAFQANAQTSPYKGKFHGVYDGRECTLNIDLYSPTISGDGFIGINPSTKEPVYYKEMKSIKCYGTLDLYFGGYMTFNILSFDDGEDMEGGSPYFIMVSQYDQSFDDATMVLIKPGRDNKSLIISDGNDTDTPLFTDLKFTRE